jgi:UDP-GlcNAc3NAcA epimerase
VKVVSVVGARPQFVKAAPVSQALRALPGVQEVLLHTGQHYDDNMSRVFFEELGIPSPDVDLGIGSLSHGAQTGRMLEGIERVLLEVRPDWVLVYGDTNSTLAGAVAAVKLHLRVAHVEAGLRSFDMRMPEEVNRVLTDHVAEVLFAPTEKAVGNLAREGISRDRVRLVGDVMYDAALFFGERASRESRVLQRLGIVPGGYVLATVHRAENTDDETRLSSIVTALAEVGRRVPVVLPLHGRTRAALARAGLAGRLGAGVYVIDPVGYLDMTMLTMHARAVVTDSGGLQKEAFFHRVPCVTLRERTEWVELVAMGWNVLASPAVPGAIVRELLGVAERRPGRDAKPYGEGDAARKIARALVDLVGEPGWQFGPTGVIS